MSEARTARPKHWLMKTEPDTFSIDDLARRGTEPWDGVRNYQARNHMRQMRVGDELFFYHSSCAVPSIVGIARVSAEAHPDPSQFDRKSDYYDAASKREEPRWSMVEVAFVRKFAQPVTLEAMKADDALDDMILVRRGNRLSVMPVSAAEWKHILRMEQKNR